MTNEKQKPAFYIFQQDVNGNSVQIGAAFRHKKGTGLNILIGKARFVAFSPKTQTQEAGA